LKPVPAPPFPGAIGISHLRVYDSEAPDGLRGGTPHIHSVCTEAYAVTRGEGAVQTLTAAGFAETPLRAGTFVWFTPGTVHRLINHGDLELFVIMQNAGLPEAGDMVITFPSEHLATRGGYERKAALPPGETTTAGSGVPARERRDLGVEGFARLRAPLERGDRRPLERFYQLASSLLAGRAARFREVWEAGPRLATQRTAEQLAALAEGQADHLQHASVHALPPPPDERRMGCCGTLGVYLAPESPPDLPPG
jgi:mannose-6-phosphate isomerase-like protein (cupin superfamily)